MHQIFWKNPPIMANKNRLLTGFSFLVMLGFFEACQSEKVDFETGKQKLLSLHQAQRDAHLQKNVEAFVAQFDQNMLSVNHGKISTMSPAAARPRIQSYFDQVSFKKWADVSPPRIEFSDDGSMAYMVVDKMVILTYLDEKKQTVEESTHFAWVSICKKQPDGEWKIVCNVSTNEPEVKKNLE